MTEYVVKAVSKSLWIIFADRRSIGACADENQALKLMMDHSAVQNTLSHPLDANPGQAVLYSAATLDDVRLAQLLPG